MKGGIALLVAWFRSHMMFSFRYTVVRVLKMAKVPDYANELSDYFMTLPENCSQI